jgi:spore coat protein U-like protein
VTSPGFAAAYDPAAPGTNTTATFFKVTCTRGLSSDPTSVPYSVTVDNGLYPLGVNNRAGSGANRIRYDVFTNATCATAWKGSTAIGGTITFSGTGTTSQQGTYWGCVGAGQGVPAGTYNDTVAMTLSYGATPASTATGAFGVTITSPSTCSLTASPGNVVFAYVSFGPAVAASTTFGVTCTVGLPYSMALSATSGTIVGLDYTLALSAASSAGTGAQQTHSIDGNMAAGQGGICGAGSCTGSQTRSVTISY